MSLRRVMPNHSFQPTTASSLRSSGAAAELRYWAAHESASQQAGLVRIVWRGTVKFNDVVRSELELRALMGGPVAPPVVEKTLSALDRHCVAFIARSPLVLIASSNADGRMDVSPKGDAPGIVRVLDEHTLAIADRPGNQRFDRGGLVLTLVHF